MLLQVTDWGKAQGEITDGIVARVREYAEFVRRMASVWRGTVKTHSRDCGAKKIKMTVSHLAMDTRSEGRNYIAKTKRHQYLRVEASTPGDCSRRKAQFYMVTLPARRMMLRCGGFSPFRPGTAIRQPSHRCRRGPSTRGCKRGAACRACTLPVALPHDGLQRACGWAVMRPRCRRQRGVHAPPPRAWRPSGHRRESDRPG
jgi:hypothetical protein